MLLPRAPPPPPSGLSPHRSHTPLSHSRQHIELTALEDRESVQVALSVVINALATGQLDTRRATAILYGLQLASSNAATIHTQVHPNDATLTSESTPEGLSLAEPATMVFVPDEEDEEDDEDDA